MLRSTIVLFALTSFAHAAPVPKESDAAKIKRLFGEVVDPDKDCTFKMDGEKLLITMPGGKRYDYNEKFPGGKRFDDRDIKTNCPCVLREVEGDFTVTLRSYAALPKDPIAVEGTTPEVGAGIIILNEQGGAWRSGMHDFLLRGKDRILMGVIPKSEGPAGFQYEADQLQDGLFTRLNRRGDKLRLEMSTDGKKWSGGYQATIGAVEKLKVGVYGFSNSKTNSTVTFSDFEIKPIEKK